MNVLVIPEDFRKDQYMLKPIVQAMMQAMGASTARVEVCIDPLLRGISQALRWERIAAIIAQYAWKVDLFLLCVDRDGNANRRQVLDSIERKADEVLAGRGKRLIAEHAWQEIEVWVLAGHDLPNEWMWRDVRAEPDPKEVYFEPFARQRGLQDEPGGGRKTLAVEAARRYDRIRQLCPEDIGRIEDVYRQGLSTR